MSNPAYWMLRQRLPPSWRPRARKAADLALAGSLGSVRATRSTDAFSLTFDDGPEPLLTPELLDLLDELSAPCTFFVLVAQCRLRPDLLRETARRGHEIALHGVDHSRITEMPGGVATRYLRDARSELEEMIQRPVRLYRPPYGAQSLRSFVAARRAGLTVAVWSDDAEDWVDRPAEQVAADGLRHLKAGSILLFHERLEPDPRRGAPTTTFDRCAVVREIITTCRAKAVEPATVGSLLATSGSQKTAWFRP